MIYPLSIHAANASIIGPTAETLTIGILSLPLSLLPW